MKTKLLILFFTIFLALSSPAQLAWEIKNINTDSLGKILPELEGKERIDVLNRIALGISLTDPDSCILISNETVLLSEKLKYQKAILDLT